METKKVFNNFIIAHTLKKRMRIIAPNLRKDAERLHILAILLNKREGIERVKVTARLGSITIYFDPDVLPEDNLCILLDSVIHNLGIKSRNTIHILKHSNRHPKQNIQDIVFGIGGMSCASCALFIEMLLQRHPDIHKVSINYITETARVKSYLADETVFEIVNNNGYQAIPIGSLGARKDQLDLGKQHLQLSKTHLKTQSLISIPVLLLSLYGKQSRSSLILKALLTTAAVFRGGRDIFKKALAQTKQGSVNMDSLIALGVGVTYSYSMSALFRPTRHVYFDAATAIIDFVLLGRYLEMLAKNKVVEDIRELVSLKPHQATLLHDNQESIINVEDIVIGNFLLVRPGELIPADGVVLQGLSSVNDTMINGTKSLCIKEAGHSVFEGSVNGSGALQIRATAIGKNTVLSGLLHMLDQAQTSKLPIQKTVDQFSTLLVPSVIILSGATFGGWLLAGEKLAHALSNAIAVLLISCPCALGLATPAANMVGTGRAARKGIYIRNGEALESSAHIDTVVFDKTGTITEGNAKVTDLFNISTLDDQKIIQLAASVEYNSEHLLGRAIVRHAKQKNIELLSATRFYSYPDQGLRATVNKHKVLLGNQLWLEKQKINLDALKSTANKLSAQGKTLIYLAINNEAAGVIALTDPIRENAEQTIKMLHKIDINTLMVTGDTEEAAQNIAMQVGVEKVISAATPQKKLQIIRDLQKQGHQVAMIGDGINDAPALAAANLSLAIDKGAGIAIESSDLILLNGDISKIYDAINLSHETLKNIKQNLFWAFSYNAVAIPFAVAGKLNPTLASATMALSSISVMVNSLRFNNR